MTVVRQLDKGIFRIAVPSILANITVPLVGIVDIAVAGHLDASAASLIGGISIGTMLFGLLYWNFEFLRISTGGLTAQAYGGSCAGCGSRNIAVAMAVHQAFISRRQMLSGSPRPSPGIFFRKSLGCARNP